MIRISFDVADSEGMAIFVFFGLRVATPCRVPFMANSSVVDFGEPKKTKAQRHYKEG
jgi:hypothetical protein